MFDIPVILAQAGAEAFDPTSGVFGLLLKNGLLGGAVALLIWLLIKRDGQLQTSQSDRLADAKVFAELVRNHTVALTAQNATNDERNRALESASRAAEKTAIVMDQLAKEVQNLNANLKGK
jgi:hypothetical protein